MISIGGDCRKGKSFLLNFLLRYLKAECPPSDTWLSSIEKLDGFSWKSGRHPDTTGIHIWPELFPINYEDGRRIAVMLMDSQGVFDSQTTYQNNVMLFALTALMSSVQIFNVTNNISEDQLQFLETVIEYANRAGGRDQLQQLVYLVRDWNCSYEQPYGLDGGNKQLEIFLKNQDRKTYDERRRVFESFKSINCFLMPFPGKNVTTNQQFHGNIHDIDVDFVKNLKDFIGIIISPKMLQPKRINGQEIQVKDFAHHMEIFLMQMERNNSEIPTENLVLVSSGRGFDKNYKNLLGFTDMVHDMVWPMYFTSKL